MPRRTHRGKLPIVGRLDGGAHSRTFSGGGEGGVWVLSGLGSRGLLYHALLADFLVTAMLAGDDSLIPPEVRFNGSFAH